MRYTYDIKFEMLQVRKDEISLRKYSAGPAQLSLLCLFIWSYIVCSHLKILRCWNKGSIFGRPTKHVPWQRKHFKFIYSILLNSMLLSVFSKVCLHRGKTLVTVCGKEKTRARSPEIQTHRKKNS